MNQELAAQYARALEEYLAGAGEAALSRAYDLGRAALGKGLGILDIAAIHRAAPKGDATDLIRAQRAAEFFAESLPAFEMAFRGYEDANHELQQLNRTLEQKNHELAVAKAAADAANRELEAFSYSVAHDLRAPLRVIDGFSLAILEDCGEQLPAVGKEHLERVRSAAARMGQLIEDLLKLSRLTRTELRREQVDLTRLCEQVIAELRKSEPERVVEVVIAEKLVAHCDERLVRVALENLIGNAWKFTSKISNPRIAVGSDFDEQGTRVFFVRDNGAGFEMAYAHKLFAPFQRLHGTSEFPGTGIGLATVARIVRCHGGRVWTEAAPNQGATFYFTV